MSWPITLADVVPSSKASNVGFLFERKGRIWLEPIEGNEAATFDSLFDVAAEGGAEDVREVEADDEGMVWEVSWLGGVLVPDWRSLSCSSVYAFC